jgi:hypothetical protein
MERFVAVTDGRTKLVQAEVDGTRFAELYDLAEDPNEFENRAEDPTCTAELARLRGAIALRYVPALLP